MTETKANAQTKHLESRVQPGSSEPYDKSGIAEPELDILHLAELVPIIRERFRIEETFSDDAILASLKTISAESSDRGRAATAFSSNIGRYLDSNSQQPSANLAALIAMLPKPRS